jgi:hypothetical protein
MLLHVDTTEIEHRCEACGARRRIPLTAMVAGVETGTPPRPGSPNIVALPACEQCLSREFWSRVAPRSGRVPEHARAVNALHAALVASGSVAGTHRETFASEAGAAERAELPWTYPGDPPPPVGRAGRGRTASVVVRRARGG